MSEHVLVIYRNTAAAAAMADTLFDQTVSTGCRGFQDHCRERLGELAGCFHGVLEPGDVAKLRELLDQIPEDEPMKMSAASYRTWSDYLKALAQKTKLAYDDFVAKQAERPSRKGKLSETAKA